MKDVSGKLPTTRVATARAVLRARAETIVAVKERRVPKGDALECSRVAAIQAVKNTPLLLPFCHPLPIESVKVEFEVGDTTIAIEATVRTFAKTGVEMEALCAVSAAALNLYDMLKMLDTEMVIESAELLKKVGGKSDPLKLATTAGIEIDANGAIGALVAARLAEFGLAPGMGEPHRVVFADADAPVGFEPDHDVQETVRARMRHELPFTGASEFSAHRMGECLWLKLPTDERLAACALDALLPNVFLSLEGR